ncbi:hypothetical protein [Actinotalea solisilvae]|uniref:hypothetical protein n=1 Tax=Actinotalea solisilvae TaxID=2072922 RepID=UPI0018F146B4|nr:hypothetical protein [Actinotalea solisilvae]
MGTALIAVLAAAVCSGAATVLQARAARRVSVRSGLDAGLLVRLATQPSYVVALALMATGFLLSFWALRTLPLFVVQAGRASSLAVAAVLAAVVLGARLSRRDVAALAAVTAGLVALAGTAGGSGDPRALPVLAMVAAGAGVVVLALAAARVRPLARGGLVLAVLAGVAFALMALAARGLGDGAPLELVGRPAVWVMLGTGVVGLSLAATALQRSPVVPATALMVATETCLGALLGIALVGDRWAPGAAPLVAGGFTAVLLGALALARFGAPDRAPAGATSSAA